MERPSPFPFHQVVPDAHQNKLGMESREARTFQKVRRDLKITQGEMSKLMGVSQMMISYIERGARRPSQRLKGLLRNLAFHGKLPYAVSVFDEHDDPEQQECPHCVALRKHRQRIAELRGRG